MSTIFTLDEETGVIKRQSTYSLPPKKALIAFIRQSENDFNTWTYPDHIDGIRESNVAKDHYYWDDFDNKRVVAAYPD